MHSFVKVWFILIGISTLLVWQHHFMDVVSGFLMGWLIKVLIPASPRRSEPLTPAHRRMALRVGGLAVAFGTMALMGGGWLWFGWPTVACAIVSIAYFRRDPRMLGKENGTLSPAAEWCLLPWMLAAKAVQHRYLQGPSSREIAPSLLLGRRHTQREAKALVSQSPLAVLDLTAEGNAPHAFRERAAYFNLPLLDLVPIDAGTLHEALEFIRKHHATRTVLVHCQLGLYRSATVVAAWLVESGITPNRQSAAAHIRNIDPRVTLA